MSDKINRVLADRAQAFTTAEQKQARDNIGAQESGDYAYSSAFSAYIPFSSVGGTGGAITGINGSAIGATAGFSGVYASEAFTGSGTGPLDRLGLNSAFTLSAPGMQPSSTVGYGGFTARIPGDASSKVEPSYVGIAQDLGGSTASARVNSNSLRFIVPLPGNTSVESVFAPWGISGVSNNGAKAYADGWASAHRYEGTGDTGNGIWVDIGHYDGTSVQQSPAITLYTPGNSAQVSISSIEKWNSGMTSVSTGYGLSGDGNGTALAVTGASAENQGMHETYYMGLDSASLSFSSVSTGGHLWMATDHNMYGMRLSSMDTADGSLVSLCRLQDDGMELESNTAGKTAYVTFTGMRLSDTATSVVVDIATVEKWNAVYDWATSQGMAPIS